MPNNYLITGYWGEPHVTAENDRGIHASMFGAGKFVLPVGKQFEATYIGNNTIRMYDGKLIDNGAIAGIPAGEYVDLRIYNAGSGMKRNDLIVFEYKRDSSTNIESGTFTVLSGAETSGTPVDPLLTYSENLLEGNAWRDQIALWRVTVEGTTIGDPVRIAPVVWDNPPMEVGVEYATSEMWLGKRVYTKVVAFEPLPNSTTAKIDHNIANVDVVLGVFGQTSYASSLHYSGVTNVYANKTQISITTNANLSGMTAYVAIKYTKTTG